MFPRWWRLGIRLQLTIIVIVGAILSTVATLFIADNAIRNYVIAQAQAQETDNSKSPCWSCTTTMAPISPFPQMVNWSPIALSLSAMAAFSSVALLGNFLSMAILIMSTTSST